MAHRSRRVEKRFESGASRPAPNPTVPRLARSYEAVAKVPFDPAIYPGQVHSAAPSLHNLSLCQGLLANERNFSLQTKCDLYELRGDGAGKWRNGLDDASLVSYIQGTMEHQSKSLDLANSPPILLDVRSLERVKMRAIFITLKREEKTSFGYQLSVSRQTLLTMLDAFRVTPHFCPFMLGEPDHWAPLDMQRRNMHSVTDGSEFVCQQPRYAIHTKQQPCSIYMGFELESRSTTYIIVSGEHEPYLDRVKSRLNDYFPSVGALGSAKLHPYDPFLLLSVICHESLVEAKAIITELRHRLYDQLDIVDTYSNSPFDRSSLKELTNKLHKVSQDADSLFASAEMATMVVEHVIRARDRALILFPHALSDVNVGDSLSYIKQSLDSQKRWILSYKSRKDIAMNLVFNLVTQQDSETNTAIARDTKDDSASMKIIAVLTMLFLPATAVSSFFGMAFFAPGLEGGFAVSKMCWLFAAVTLPLTILTLSMWWMWHPVSRFLAKCLDGISLRRRNKAGTPFRDEERGIAEEVSSITVHMKSSS